jgi:hypothetical protein
MDWIDLAQDRDRLAPQEGFCFMDGGRAVTCRVLTIFN